LNVPPTLLDGGMGQELVRRARALSGRSPTALWSTEVLADAPEQVTGLHADYLAAGADVITMATYTATPQRLARDGLPERFEALQRTGARCARDARERSGRTNVRIAACLPPLVASYRADVQPDPPDARRSYERIVACQRELADLMLCETMSTVQEACIAAEAALASGLPVWVALTIEDRSNDPSVPRLRGGETLQRAIGTLEALGIDALLLNCSSPEAITDALPVLSSTSLPFGAYANAFRSIADLLPGGTVDALQGRHDLGPVEYANVAVGWHQAGARLIGGCCETTPAHVAELGSRLRSGS